MATKFNITPTRNRISVATGLQDIGATVMGYINSHITVEDAEGMAVTIPHRVYLVSGLAHVCFLGNDFLDTKSYAGQGRNQVYINTDPREVRETQKPPQCLAIPIEHINMGTAQTLLCSYTTTIPARETRMVSVQGLTEGKAYDIDSLDFPSPHLKPVSCSIIAEDDAQIPVSNDTETEIVLEAETPIACATEAEEAYLCTLSLRSQENSEPELEAIFESVERLDEEAELPGIIGETPKTDEEMLDSVEMKHLSGLEEAKYRKLLRDNIDIFSRTSTDIGKSRLFTGFTRVKQGMDPADWQAKHIPIPMNFREKVQKICHQLIAAKVLRYATEPVPCLTNVHVRVKPNGNIRLCLDSRSTNYFTERLAAAATYTLEEVLTKLKGKNVTMIDVSQSFFNIPMHPDSWKHFSFLDPDKRVLQLTRASQGHHNSPAFQSMNMRLTLDLPASHDRVDSDEIIENPLPDEEEATQIPSPTNFLVKSGSMIQEGDLLPPGQLPKDSDNILLFNIWDDLAVATDTSLAEKGHIEALQLLFNKIRKSGMKLRIEKLQLCKPKIKILGMIFDAKHLHIPQSRFQALRDMKITSPRALKSFVASAAYYRSFCPSFSAIARPLIKMSHKKKEDFNMGVAETEARETLLDTLDKHSKRRLIGAEDNLILSTDASKYAAAAILEVRVEEDHTELAASFSKLFSDTETRHDIFSKEAATIIAALAHFEYYLRGSNNLTLRTDVLAMSYIKQTVTSSTVSFRLSNEMSKYNFDIVHVPTKLHIIPDTISREVGKEESTAEKTITPAEAAELMKRIKIREGARFTKHEAINIIGTQLPSLITGIKQDSRSKPPSLLPPKAPKKTIISPQLVHSNEATRKASWRKTIRANTITLQEEESLPLSVIKAAQESLDTHQISPSTFAALQWEDPTLSHHFPNPSPPYSINEQRLLVTQEKDSNSNLLCVPDTLMRPILELLHKPSPHIHISKGAVKRKFKNQFHSPNLECYLDRIYNRCGVCATKAFPPRRKVPDGEAYMPQFPRTAYYMDIMDGSTEFAEKQRYYLVAVCAASNYITAAPLQSRDQEEVLQCIIQTILIPFGRPKAIICDRESAFTSKHTLDYLEANDIHIHFISAYSPQSNAAEKAIKKIKTVLRPTAVETDNWNEAMPVILESINNTPMQNAQVTPEQLFFGRQLHRVFPRVEETNPNEITLHTLNAFMQRRRELAKQKRIQTNKRRKPKDFKEGEIVLVRDPAIKPGKNIIAPSAGLHIVRGKTAYNTYLLDNIKTHASTVKHANHVFPVELDEDVQFLSKGWDSLIEKSNKPVLSKEDQCTTPKRAESHDGEKQVSPAETSPIKETEQ